VPRLSEKRSVAMPSRHALVSLVALPLVLAGSPAGAQSVAIDEKPVGCLVVGKYPRLSACLSPAAQVARARVYFKPEGAPIWYYVEMKRQAPCYDGILPKPTRKLVGKKVLYYLGASDRQFVESRTADRAVEVVGSEAECRKDLPPAPFVTNASVTVLPSLPAGFSAAGIGAGTAIAIGGGAALVAGGGIALAASKGGGDSAPTTVTTPSTPPSPTASDNPTPSPTVTPTPTAENRPPVPDFRVNPDPPEGPTPLDVTFNMCKSVDPDGDALTFAFDFGDGSTFRGNCRSTHRYEFPPGPPAAAARICVGDGRRGHDSCQDYTVKVRNACASDSRPPTVSMGKVDGGRTPVVLGAQASDNVGVTAVEFLAAEVEGPYSIVGVDRDPPFSVQWKPSPACHSFAVIARAHDACGNQATSEPVFFTHSDPSVCNRDAAAAPASSVELTSELALPQGAGHFTVNGRGAVAAGNGRLRLGVAASSGDNRVEAVVGEANGRPGTWRFELTGDVLPGTLRVDAGEVVQVAGDAVVFRLSGRAGERIAFRFRATSVTP
jgi:hypothetical protein